MLEEASHRKQKADPRIEKHTARRGLTALAYIAAAAFIGQGEHRTNRIQDQVTDSVTSCMYLAPNNNLRTREETRAIKADFEDCVSERLFWDYRTERLDEPLPSVLPASLGGSDHTTRDEVRMQVDAVINSAMLSKNL